MKKTVTIVLSSLCLLGLIFFGYQHYTQRNRVDSKTLLDKLALSFKMYANESRGELWPAANKNLGIEDIDALIPIYGKNDPELAAYLKGEKGVEICYLGYTMLTETTALAAMKCYEKALVQKDQNGTIQPKFILYEGDLVSKFQEFQMYKMASFLREGIEGFFNDINAGPGWREARRRELPIMWEMPDNQNPPGGWILYLDGHSEWLPYPGKFPMTRRMITKARELKGEAHSKQVTTCPYEFYNRPSPSYPNTRLGGILNTLNETTVNFISRTGKNIHWEKTIEISIDEISGYRIDSTQGSLVFFPDNFELDISDVEYIFTHKNEDWMKSYLGKSEGFRWYACMDTKASSQIQYDFFMETQDAPLHISNSEDANILVLSMLPNGLFEKYKEAWLSESGSADLVDCAKGLYLLHSEESMAILNKGLNTKHPSFIEHFRAIQEINHLAGGREFTGKIYEECLPNLSFEQRVAMALEFSKNRFWFNYHPSYRTIKLLEPYSADDIMKEVHKRLAGTEKKNDPILNGLEVYLRSRQEHP